MRHLKPKLIILFVILLASLLIVSVVYAQGGGPGTPTDNDVNRSPSNLLPGLSEYAAGCV
jgi:hypothetical protein